MVGIIKSRLQKVCQSSLDPFYQHTCREFYCSIWMDGNGPFISTASLELCGVLDL